MLDRVNDDLLTIGQFARLCRLSVKQLRHYADIGLLAPARVDRDTGYRYYRAAQARDALAIGLLRSLDVPLAAIGPVLAGDPGETLGGVRDRLEGELARRRRTLATLERVLADGLPKADVHVAAEPPHSVACVRDVAAGPEDIGPVTSAAVAQLISVLGVPGQMIGLFPVDLGEHIPVTVAAVVPGAPSPVPPGLRADVLPGGTFAVATHVGPYDQIALTAHALLAWCAERGRAPAGPIREVYLSDPATTPPERLVTNLMIPLEESP